MAFRRSRFTLVSLVVALAAAVYLLWTPAVKSLLPSQAAVAPATSSSARAPAVRSSAEPSSEVLSVSPRSRSAPPRALFAFVHPAGAVALDAALPAPARRIDYVRLDAALIAGQGSPFWQPPGMGRVVLPLAGGGALTVVIDESVMLGPDRWTSMGHLEGHPGARAVFAWNRGFLHASVTDAALASYALRAATADVAQFYRVDPGLVPPCGGGLPVAFAAGRAPAVRTRAMDTPGSAAPAGPGFTPAVQAASATGPQGALVDVMFAYTPSVLTTLTGPTRAAALLSAFDAEIAKVNSDLAASLVTTRVRLVKIVETAYNESASAPNLVQSDALSALYGTSDGQMDELHAIRDQCGADLVCLALGRPSSVSIGLAFVLTTPGDDRNAAYAFSVVQYDVMAGTQVVPHELGHNFGCAHDRQSALNGPGAYSYSYGYRFTGSDGVLYRDIMAYAPGAQLGYYGNPNVTAPAPIGVPVGLAPQQIGEADTALTIEQEAFEVAGFRLQMQTAPSSGALINVATRAYAGTGEQALIGGFVIGGTVPKTILIRAAGPTLATFGVTGVLAAPALELYAGPALVATNAGWGRQTAPATAAAVSSASLQVGAFAFGAGSADSALLVTLAPGAYTALVHGADGGAGAALLEAYDLSAGTGKIANLSTRGYADSADREMLGGFVVSAAPGATKRILIRVLGPTLARFGVAAAMSDPYLELHNSAGDLVLFNDDWSSGAANDSSGVRDDFQPTVTQYSEQQIVATGFAPANRREPCVLLDLPPGSYTVVARPFANPTTDATLNQPPRPGIALVEVYEINP